MNEATETDLWDIDFGGEDVPIPAENAQGTPVQLPAQRQSVSKISTKKPTDLRPKSTAGDVTIHTPPTAETLVPAPASEESIEPHLPEIGQAEATPKWKETENGEPEPTDQNPEPIIPPNGALSKIEKIAISGLFAALALSGILTVIHFSNRVPTRLLVTEEIDFPVSGKIIEITAASTYWREPDTSGEKADIVRRGTQLIPVLKLSLNTKSGAIRVFFRNEDGIVIGDGITRSVKGNTEVTVPATAGFEDVGMHTAYRTGDGKRWIVQVFEAPSATAPREKFQKVLETEISTFIQ